MNQKAKLHGFLCFLILAALLSFHTKANADVAPPSLPPGANPQPEADITEVRMMSEIVTIEILEDTPEGSLGQAKVTASFNMRNLGDETESMAVRFPISASDGFGRFPEISDMQVKVDGRLVETWKIEGEDPSGYDYSVPWMAFNVTFRPATDVTIQVTYTLEASGEIPFVGFSYVFSTGASWKGTIGSATLFVRFPYDVDSLNVLPSYTGNVFPDHQLSGRELKWAFTDFEPQPGDNFKISIVAPSIWQDVLLERNNVTVKSTDGEAWGRLAKLYKELAFSSRRRGFRYGNIAEDEGAQNLVNLSISAYEKALQRKPFDPLWHAGFADLLGYYASYAGHEGLDTRAEAVRALQEIQTALEYGPNDDKVLEIADSLTYELEGAILKAGDHYEFPWLTATPLLIATPAFEEASTPTNEVIPSFTPTATPATEGIENNEKKDGTAVSNPICGSVIFVPLVLLFGLFIKRIS